MAAAALLAVAATATPAHELPPAAAALLLQAEAALDSGDGDAIGLFERAAAYAHESAIEAGQVRALMQAGRYREALAFAAHVAGAHADDPHGTVLYAWLLHIGGQAEQARLRIEAARLRWPHDDDVAALHRRIVQAQPPDRAAPLLDQRPLAPAPRGGAPQQVPADAYVLTAAVRVAPDAAIAAWPPGPPPAALWIRDALGHTRATTMLHHDAVLGVAVLGWREALGSAVAFAPRDGFPGSPAYTMGYAAVPDAAPQWPRLSIGFLGMPQSGSHARGLNTDMLGTQAGGPVFDSAGRLQGLTLVVDGTRPHHLPHHPPRYLPLSAWRALAGLPAPTTASEPAPARLAPDAVYELALPLALQVLAR